MIYDKLKEKENQIKELTSLGLVNPVWIRNIEIFELYQEKIEEGEGVYDAYFKVAYEIKPQISWQSVKKIVTDLSK